MILGAVFLAAVTILLVMFDTAAIHGVWKSVREDGGLVRVVAGGIVVGVILLLSLVAWILVAGVTIL